MCCEEGPRASLALGSHSGFSEQGESRAECVLEQDPSVCCTCSCWERARLRQETRKEGGARGRPGDRRKGLRCLKALSLNSWQSWEAHEF